MCRELHILTCDCKDKDTAHGCFLRDFFFVFMAILPMNVNVADVISVILRLLKHVSDCAMFHLPRHTG